MSQHLQEDRGAATSPDIWYTVATGAENIYMFYRGSYSVFNFFAIFLLVLSREWGNDPQQLIINNSASNPQQPIHSLLSTTKMIGLEYIDIWYTVATGAENMYIYMYNYIYNYIYICIVLFLQGVICSLQLFSAIFLLVLSREWGNDPQQLSIIIIISAIPPFPSIPYWAPVSIFMNCNMTCHLQLLGTAWRRVVEPCGVERVFLGQNAIGRIPSASHASFR